MMHKFYLKSVPANFNDASAWSLSSGGPVDTTPPGFDDIACFDSSGNAPCIIDGTTSIAGLIMAPDYTATIHQELFPLTTGSSGLIIQGGYFYSADQSLQVNGPLTVDGGSLYAMDSTISLHGSSTIAINTPGSINPITEDKTLTSQDISAKSVIASYPCDGTYSVSVGGTPKYDGTDFYTRGIRICWDGMALESTLSVGSVLSLAYDERNYKKLHQTGGKVILSGAGTFDPQDSTFETLEISNTNGVHLASSSTVRNMLTMSEGYLTGDATIHVHGDASCSAVFGTRQDESRSTILFDGSRPQYFYYTPGAILPNVLVDKTTSGPVTLRGTGPVLIDGDLIVNDGTFNTNGLDIRAGT